MNLHEYQAKEILRKYGIPVPDFAVISDLKEVPKAINDLHLTHAVIKVQVHAGGRGKAGGVKFVKNADEIVAQCKNMLGMHIVNNQTGPEGIIAHQLLLTAPVEIKKEYYISAIIDREKAEAILIISPEGGMDIEEIADKKPDRILKLPIGSDGTLKSEQLRQIAKFMGWDGKIAEQGMKVASLIAKAFLDTDASLLEINPLVLTKDDQLVALDAKLSIDDNALFRHKDLAAYYDPTQVSPFEVQAKQYDLSFVALDGNIGCMVNGAGLAMATMDIIQHFGGMPANFLDVGGGASAEKVSQGFKLILSAPKVKAILVNIFGGIMNCATLAEGIISAAKELEIKVPVIVRMEGTNVEAGRKMLADAKLNIILANDLTEAAKKAVAMAK